MLLFIIAFNYILTTVSALTVWAFILEGSGDDTRGSANQCHEQPVSGCQRYGKLITLAHTKEMCEAERSVTSQTASRVAVCISPKIRHIDSWTSSDTNLTS